jgi:predicted acylesterase/phospholipase RssA
MKEFYENTGIDVHLFATEFNETTIVDISWKTQPDWTVIESIYCSCCLPFLFSPYFKDDCIYYDGGVFCNYPLEQCITNENAHPDEILGIKTNIRNDQPFNENSTLFDYVTHLMKKIINSSNEKIKREKICIKNEIVIDSVDVSLYDIYLAVSNIEIRTHLIEEGAQIWKEFVS